MPINHACEKSSQNVPSNTLCSTIASLLVQIGKFCGPMHEPDNPHNNQTEKNAVNFKITNPICLSSSCNLT